LQYAPRAAPQDLGAQEQKGQLGRGMISSKQGAI